MRITMGRRCAGLALACCAILATTAGAQQKGITAADGWVRLPAQGETTTTAFASIENPGMYAVYLVSASSDVAGKIEFRDAARGAQPVDEVTVPAYDTAYLNPKGIHMFLSDLKRGLAEGDKVSITLTTEQGIKVEVTAAVRKE